MTHVSSPAAIGAVIRAERKRQGFTQIELAGLSGVGITFLSQLENGKATAELGKTFAVLTMLGIDVFTESRGE